MDHESTLPRHLRRRLWPVGALRERAYGSPSRIHDHPDRPPLAHGEPDDTAHRRAWAAHVAAGRIGAGPPPRVPAPPGSDFALASLEAILRGARS